MPDYPPDLQHQIREQRYEITLWIPLLFAAFAALIGVLGTVFIAGKSDTVSSEAFRQYTLRVDDHFAEVEKEVSALDARISKTEGLMQSASPRR